VGAEKRKDVETAMRYWGDNAVLHAEGAPAVRGQADIRKAYADFFAAPMTFDSAKIGEIRVANSGDLAYETGVNHFTMTAGNKKTPATGKYLAVWGRRPDGTWVVESIAVTNDKAASAR
jgi:ketosteroid isomerase-like protein